MKRLYPRNDPRTKYIPKDYVLRGLDPIKQDGNSEDLLPSAQATQAISTFLEQVNQCLIKNKEYSDEDLNQLEKVVMQFRARCSEKLFTTHQRS